MTFAAVRDGDDVAGGLALRLTPVVADGAWSRHGRMIEASGRPAIRCVAFFALIARANVIWRLTRRERTIVTGPAEFRRALEDAVQMTALAVNIAVPPVEGKAGLHVHGDFIRRRFRLGARAQGEQGADRREERQKKRAHAPLRRRFRHSS